MTIYLASLSPRRRMLLEKIGVPFEVLAPEVEELSENGMDPVEFVKRNAYLKANDVLSRIADGIVIAADTVVVKGEHLLGKPQDKDDAYQMLAKLSGTHHYVYTALVVVEKLTGKKEMVVEKTLVQMRNLTDREIQRYIDSGEPLDAAGAYKIQETGAKFITRIEGCYYNVVGLPIARLVEIFHHFGIEI